MNKNYIIKRSNYFIMNSSYDLSLEEQKIILTLASMVQPEDEEFKPYKFKISNFLNLLGIEDQSKYTEVPKITKELMKKVFEIQEDNTLIQTAWLAGAKYEKGTGYVELTFSPYLKPYMLKLNTMFTQYKLSNILRMKSKYSPRIYELLKCNEFRKQGYIELEVEELRKLLKAETIYPKYNDFKRYIIIRTQKELKKVSDISFEFEEIKTGRKITSIKFYIKTNKPKEVINPFITPKEDNHIAPNEIAASITDEAEIVRQANLIGQVQGIFIEDITELEAKEILAAARKDIEIIKSKYQIARRITGIRNIVSWMLSAIKKDYQEPKQGLSEKIDIFNDYEQRNYDYEDLERKLLGWDKN